MSYGKPTSAEIEALELEIHEKSIQLARLKRAEAPQPVSDYTLEGPDGPVRLSAAFGDQSDLIVVHNWHLFALLAGGPGEWGPRFEY